MRFHLRVPQGQQYQKPYRTHMIAITKSVRQAFLINILILRESAGCICRRLYDLYRTGYFSLTQDLFIIRNRKFLLGVCLISFAEDMISEDDMIV